MQTEYIGCGEQRDGGGIGGRRAERAVKDGNNVMSEGHDPTGQAKTSYLHLEEGRLRP